MGYYQFCRMPFGLTGAPASFQRLIDKILRGLPFVSTYIDDILVFSSDPVKHKEHLHQVFDRLQKAGLTLRGKKCHIGLSQVTYLGHVFSAKGMSPDLKKTQAVVEWPQPTDVAAVRQFIGLASYYRHYIANFAQVAAPLHQLTQKCAPFHWNTDCENAFINLKNRLSTAPILSFSQFDSDADDFSLYTDASTVGVGTVMEQSGKVIAYASRSLTQAERQCSTIQKECLAIVYATKQFRHYLLGRHFNLYTDHAPFQWLSWKVFCVDEPYASKNMISLLCIKGVHKTRMQMHCHDLMQSHPTAATILQPSPFLAQLKEAQMKDEYIRQLHSPLATSQTTLKG